MLPQPDKTAVSARPETAAILSIRMGRPMSKRRSNDAAPPRPPQSTRAGAAASKS
jgi:hypothetical protein